MEEIAMTSKKAVTISAFADYYKARSKIQDQERRRQQLLHQQKRNRHELFDKGRSLIDLEDDPEVQELQDEPMDYCSSKHTRKRQYCGILMMSEWLLEVPSDLDSHWFVMPCPVGKRTLVVSSRRGTRAYDKRGIQTASFSSALPAGTMLDCIWSKESRKYFVLDILVWNDKTLFDCETEFRFYWMETKFQQDSPAAMKESTENPFPFFPLPYRRCTMDVVRDILSGVEVPGGSLDGLLFYHSESHYTAGSTPLVGWLKPHMIPEVLGVDVHPRYLEERPSDYESLALYIQNAKKAKKCKKYQNHWQRGRSKPMKMETECIHDGSSYNTKCDDLKGPDAIECECDSSVSDEQTIIDATIENISSDSCHS